MKSEQRKKEIIKTAERLFKQKGYSAVTMRDIAQDLGIKAASLYNHIQSKQQLLSEIIITIGEQFTKGMEKIVNEDSTNLQKLEKIIALHVQITGENPSKMAAMNNDWMHLEEKLDYYLSLRKNYEESFRNILLDGIKSGEIENPNPEIILFSILSTLRSLYLWMPKKEDVPHDTLAKNLSQILLKGIINS